MLNEVANISTNNDAELGKIIADAYKKVGQNGVVLMEESDTDVYWCERGTVVMTPLQLDCTDYDALRIQQDWTPEVSDLT